jgi:predicted DNA binding CopG/RHH family protein
MSRVDLKPLPEFSSDEEAERFVDEADLTAYDLSGFRPVRLVETAPVDLPRTLVDRLGERAAVAGISRDRYIASLLEEHLAGAPK